MIQIHAIEISATEADRCVVKLLWNALEIRTDENVIHVIPPKRTGMYAHYVFLDWSDWVVRSFLIAEGQRTIKNLEQYEKHQQFPTPPQGCFTWNLHWSRKTKEILVALIDHPEMPEHWVLVSKPPAP